MATYKILGQSAPAATANTDLYTVPGSTQAVISTLTICNQASTSATYRIAARQGGAAIASKHYVAYDATVPANSTVTLTLGIALAATDVLTVYASSSTVSFSAFGVENP